MLRLIQGTVYQILHVRFIFGINAIFHETAETMPSYKEKQKPWNRVNNKAEDDSNRKNQIIPEIKRYRFFIAGFSFDHSLAGNTDRD